MSLNSISNAVKECKLQTSAQTHISEKINFVTHSNLYYKTSGR